MFLEQKYLLFFARLGVTPPSPLPMQKLLLEEMILQIYGGTHLLPFAEKNPQISIWKVPLLSTSGFQDFDLFQMTYKGGHWTAIAVVYNGYKTKI